MRKALHATSLGALVIGLGLSVSTPVGGAEPAAPALADYKYFRSLCIDLLGRMPTLKEIEAFETPGFDLNAWIEDHLRGDDYAERMTRVYADLLRPQINGLRYSANRNGLARIAIKDETGKDIWLYFRQSTKRARTALMPKSTDPSYPKWNNLARGGLCLLEDEIGLKWPDINAGQPPTGTAKPVDRATLDAWTTVVRPWWLYSDYKSATPTQRYDAATWATKFPGYVLNNEFLKEPNGTTDVVEIRVCKEEAQAALTAKQDSNQAIEVSCQSGYGVAQSTGCGCGPGLEWCMPALTFNVNQPRAGFQSSRNVLLGVDDPADQVAFSFYEWQSLWLGQEPLTYLSRMFLDDADFRQIVTGRHTYVNGPLAQFYRLSARAPWNDRTFGATTLPDPATLPADLLPMETTRWAKIDDRGANAAGILTMPLFLFKNATRRARAHIVYNMFLCRDFVAPAGLQLPISTEPNLMKREGCAACHQTLEPLAAYFSRSVEADWNWLDSTLYPTTNPTCKKTGTTIPGSCTSRYDVTFSTDQYGMLRGAYASTEHADQGPAGLGQYLAGKPEFAHCAAQNFAQSFLGRDMRTEDGELLQQLADELVSSGFRPRAMIKKLLTSPAYRSANNLSSTVIRQGGAQ